ncbi:PAS domain S-box protein [Dyadobacter chenhuakuii]|uniref:histidine kinase n=1 Tax=Dyadobacter chenhuakuii TaxID=2909339 RepID=A0A9X1Q8R1_9BACT|nr:PAS domain S-box protein [Dyadobacter chenhuakuii]MCF2497220.1 PAS domain S-box protein [Dyadobacter chenhuakuii]
MESSLKIVYLENSHDQANIVTQALQKADLLPVIKIAGTREQFIAAVTESAPDIILSEYNLPGIKCTEALEILRSLDLTIPFIVISDAVSDTMAEEMLLTGVDDYMIKNQAGRLSFAVHKALEKYQVKREQQALLQQLTNSERRFRTLVENSSDAVVILDREARPTYVSHAVKNVLGYTAEEVMAMDIFSKAHPEDLSGLSDTMMKVFANPGTAIPGHTGRMLHKDGTWRWIEATVTNLLDEPAVNGIVDNFRDITKQKVSEDKILHLNRLYAFLSQVNHTVVHAPDAQTVLKEVCRIACETGKFQGAWVGMFVHDTEKINVVEQHAVPEEFMAGLANVAGEQTMLRSSLESQPYYITNNTQEIFLSDSWKALAALAGYQSCLVLPIKRSGEIVGTFNLYASETDIFTEAEITLLEEAAMEISYSLDFFEKERLKLIADEQLKHKERRLRQAQAIAHLGSWETDLTTNTSVWSDEACRIYGLEDQDNIQSTASWLSFVYPEDLEYVIKSNQRVLDSMQPADYHHRIIRKDGQVRHLHVRAQIELNSLGEPATLYGVLHDVTEQKQADEKVIKALEERKVILESIGDGFYALDKNWTVNYWNKEAEILLHLPKEKILGRSLWDVFPHVVQTTIYEKYNKAVELNAIQHFEFYYAMDNTWFEITAYPSLNGLSAYFRDITERKESESRLRELNENLRNYASELSESNKGLDQFAYIVSHNLRAPVANIIGLGELISQDAYPQPVKDEFLEGILLNVKRLDDVISDLNTILRIKREVSENKESVNLQHLVDNIRSSLQNIIDREQVSIQTDFRAVDELFTLKTYLYSIFYNLIINSIKYRRPDLSPVIYISSSLDDGLVNISIRDNGMGIDLTRKGSQIFGLYKRFHQHVEGKGLGLFMVKTQVEMLGGKIHVNSTVNEGTEFKIEFQSELNQNPVI